MSYTYIRVIPVQPDFVPDPVAAEKARALLAARHPEGEEIAWRITPAVEFIDCGECFDSIACPNCSSLLDYEWWSGSAMVPAFQKRFTDLRIVTPCCGFETTLNGLVYDSPIGFARAALEIMNPSGPIVELESGRRVAEMLVELEPDLMAELQRILGVDLRGIFAHY